MIGKISIHGHIGPSYVDETGKFHKGVELLDVIEQAESFPEATSFEVSINSPGGFVDVGNSIYDYLQSLNKSKRPVTTIQDGLVGSISTKIFLAGVNRIVDDRYKFWIHNPFQEKVTGDADQLRAHADSLDEVEKDLRKFYAEFNTIGDVGIDGLMKIETGLTADQCLKFKFGTAKKKVAAFNTIKTNMSTTPKKDDTLKGQFLALVEQMFPGKDDKKKKGVAPKAAIPVNDKQNVMVKLAGDSGQFWIEADVLAVGVAAFMVDEAGEPTAEPVADGVYHAENGQMITIAGGKVSELTEEEEMEEEEVVTEEAIKEVVNAAVAKVKAELEEKYKADIQAIKKDVKLGVAPKKAVIQAPKGEAYTVRTIAQVQKERAEKNKAK